MNKLENAVFIIDDLYLLAKLKVLINGPLGLLILQVNTNTASTFLILVQIARLSKFLSF